MLAGQTESFHGDIEEMSQSSLKAAFTFSIFTTFHIIGQNIDYVSQSCATGLSADNLPKYKSIKKKRSVTTNIMCLEHEIERRGQAVSRRTEPVQENQLLDTRTAAVNLSTNRR